MSDARQAPSVEQLAAIRSRAERLRFEYGEDRHEEYFACAYLWDGVSRLVAIETPEPHEAEALKIAAQATDDLRVLLAALDVVELRAALARQEQAIAEQEYQRLADVVDRYLDDPTMSPLVLAEARGRPAYAESAPTSPAVEARQILTVLARHRPPPEDLVIP